MRNYKVLKSIGKGSYGSVFVCQNKTNKKKYVLKRIPISEMNKKEVFSSKQEVELIERLKHPNIVAYKDSFLDRGNKDMCIIMTHCAGGDLSKKLKKYKRGKRLSEDEVMNIFVQILVGIDFMHTRKVLHRDLKAQNIFLTKEGDVKIGDFGIAKILSKTLDLAKTSIGTPLYMSPEVCNNKKYGFKSDVWSCGCILYELTCLKHPFDARDLRGLFLKILRGVYSPVPYKYSAKLRNLIRKMLYTNPKKRPDIRTICCYPYVQKYIKIYMRKVMSNNKLGKNNKFDINATFNSTHIEFSNFMLQLNELGIDMNESSSSGTSSPTSNNNDVKRNSSKRRKSKKESGVKKKNEVEEEVIRLKKMEEENKRARKVLKRLKGEGYYGRGRQRLLQKRQRKGRSNNIDSSSSPSSSNNGSSNANPLQIQRERRNRIKKKQKMRERSLAEKIKEKQRNAARRRKDHYSHGTKNRRKSGMRKKSRKKSSGIGKNKMDRETKEILRKRKEKKEREIMEEKKRIQMEIESLEKKINQIEENSKRENEKFVRSNHRKIHDRQSNINEKQKEANPSSISSISSSNSSNSFTNEIGKDSRSYVQIIEKQKKINEDNYRNGLITHKEYILKRKELRKTFEEKKKFAMLAEGRKEYLSRRQHGRMQLYEQYHHNNPNISPIPNYSPSSNNGNGSNNNDPFKKLEKQLPPSQYDDSNVNDDDDVIEIIDDNDEDDEKKLIEDYEKRVLEQEKTISKLKKTLSQKYGDEFTSTLKSIQKIKGKHKRGKRESVVVSNSIEVLSLKNNSNSFPMNIPANIEVIDHDSDDEDDEDDEDESGSDTDEDEDVETIDGNIEHERINKRKKGGPLAERVEYLRGLCVKKFGLTLFEKIYKFYKEEYHVLKSDQKKFHRLRQILIKNEDKLEFCHLCDELIFVEKTLDIF